MTTVVLLGCEKDLLKPPPPPSQSVADVYVIRNNTKHSVQVSKYFDEAGVSNEHVIVKAGQTFKIKVAYFYKGTNKPAIRQSYVFRSPVKAGILIKGYELERMLGSRSMSGAVGLDKILSSNSELNTKNKSAAACFNEERTIANFTRCIQAYLRAGGRMLSVRNAGIKNTKFISRLTKQQKKNILYLDIADNKISELSNIQELPNLTSIKAWGNPLKDISGIERNNELESVLLPEGVEVDFDKLKHLQKLKVLHAERCKRKNYASIGRLKELRKLNLAGCHIDGVSELRPLKKLQYLYLNGNNIKDIEPLANLKNLLVLNLNDNRVSAIEALGRLNKLKIVELENNMINDAEVLVDHPSLRYGKIAGNKIPGSQGKKLLWLAPE